jgi:hypothetical protein
MNRLYRLLITVVDRCEVVIDLVIINVSIMIRGTAFVETNIIHILEQIHRTIMMFQISSGACTT